MRRSEVERHIGDLAVEPERHLIILVIHPGARVDADIEALVARQQEWNRLRDLQSPHLLAVDLQYAGAALCDAGSIIGEVKHDAVFASGNRLIACPSRLQQGE